MCACSPLDWVGPRDAGLTSNRCRPRPARSPAGGRRRGGRRGARAGRAGGSPLWRAGRPQGRPLPLARAPPGAAAGVGVGRLLRGALEARAAVSCRLAGGRRIPGPRRAAVAAGRRPVRAAPGDGGRRARAEWQRAAHGGAHGRAGAGRAIPLSGGVSGIYIQICVVIDQTRRGRALPYQAPHCGLSDVVTSTLEPCGGTPGLRRADNLSLSCV